MRASDESWPPSTVRPTPALPPWMLAGFACAVGLFIGVGFLNAWNIQRVYEANAAVIHAHAVHTSLDQVLAALLDAETGQRGFIITGAPGYLEPYNDAADRIQSRIGDARELIADDSEQRRDLTLLTATVQSKLDELQETIRLRRDVGFAPAQQRIQTDAGKRPWTGYEPLSRAWNREKTGF